MQVWLYLLGTTKMSNSSSQGFREAPRKGWSGRQPMADKADKSGEGYAEGFTATLLQLRVICLGNRPSRP